MRSAAKPAAATAVIAKKQPAPCSQFKDLNTVYTEELNRDDGYWSSTSSSGDDEDDNSSSARAPLKMKGEGEESSKTRFIKQERKKANTVDFRLDTKEQARREWLWATGQLGAEPEEVPRAVASQSKPTSTASKEAQTANKVVPQSADSSKKDEPLSQLSENKSPTAAPSQDRDTNNTNNTITDTKNNKQQLATTEASSATTAAAAASVTATPPPPPAASVSYTFHSLEWLENNEFEKAQQQWMASDFERPFNAEMEMKEARRRAAARFHQQQAQPITSHFVSSSSRSGYDVEAAVDPSAAASSSETAPILSTATLLNHFASQEDEWERRMVTERIYDQCVAALEALVRSDSFLNRIQRFLAKHHRSLLSTKVMREAGEYCHEDHAVFKAYVEEMEGPILKCLHRAAKEAQTQERRRLVAAKKGLQSYDRGGADVGGGGGNTAVSGVTTSGVSVIVRLEQEEDGDDDADNNNGAELGGNADFSMEFDEEDFFDYLFTSNTKNGNNSSGSSSSPTGAAAGYGDVLSFEAWEALLSVLHFNSFIDLVDEYIAAEYGLDELEDNNALLVVGSKTARSRGLPTASSSHAATTSPTPSVSSTPSKAMPSVANDDTTTTTTVGVTTPSPPKTVVSSSTSTSSSTAAGSGAAMRRLFPSSTAASGGFTASSSSSTPTNGGKRSSSSAGGNGAGLGGGQQRISPTPSSTLSKSLHAPSTTTATKAPPKPNSAPKPGSRTSSLSKK